MSHYEGLVISGTDDKPVAGIKKGTAAIWDAGADGTDWGPAIDPITNINKVKFHNDLNYLGVRRIVKHTDSGMSSVAIPATAETSSLQGASILFAHGLGYRPLIFGNIIFSGGYVQPCNGSVLPMVGGNPSVAPYMPRFFSFRADETYVYLYVFGNYQPAMTVGWTVYVIDSEFKAPISNNVLFKFSPESAVFASLGPIDSDHRFIRKASGAGEFRILGKQTLGATISGGQPVLNYSNGDVDAAFHSTNSITYPSGSLHVTGTECEVEGSAVSDAPGFYFEHPMRMVGDDGKLIFTTEKAMLAGLRRYTGNITTHTIAPTSDHSTLYSYDHLIGPSSGGDILFGWVLYDPDGNGALVSNISGSVALGTVAVKYNSFYAAIIIAMAMISLKVSGGNVYLMEHGWSHSFSDPPIAGVNINPVTIGYEIYSGKMVGGS